MLYRTTVLSLVIILSLISPASNAQDDSDALVSDRPFFSQSPNIVPKGTFQIEGGYTRIYTKIFGVKTTSNLFPDLLVKFGISNVLELRLGGGINYQNIDIEQFNIDTSDFGVSDIYFGSRIKLTRENGVDPDASLEIFSIFPTGPDPDGHLVFGISLLFRASPSELSFVSSSSTITSAKASSVDIIFIQSFAFNFNLLGGFSFFIEPIMVTQKSSSEFVRFDPIYLLNTGFTFKHSNKLHSDFYFGKNTDFPSNNYFTGIGFSFRP